MGLYAAVKRALMRRRRRRMDDYSQWFREREAIQEAQRQEAARWTEREAVTFMARQPELRTYPTYQMEDSGRGAGTVPRSAVQCARSAVSR